jgi:hypothetical protein
MKKLIALVTTEGKSLGDIVQEVWEAFNNYEKIQKEKPKREAEITAKIEKENSMSRS